MLKRDLSYDLFSRELQALDELFSREPEARVEWAGFARAPASSPKKKVKFGSDQADGSGVTDRPPTPGPESGRVTGAKGDSRPRR